MTCRQSDVRKLFFRIGPANRLLGILLLGMIVAGMPQGVRGDEPKQKPKTVELVIDFGDGFQMKYSRITWRKEMTVLDVLKRAAKHSHPLDFEYRGSGDRTFVTEIEGQKNQGARGRNWIYSVGDKLGDRSCGVYPVHPGDKVLWSFKRYP